MVPMAVLGLLASHEGVLGGGPWFPVEKPSVCAVSTKSTDRSCTVRVSMAAMAASIFWESTAPWVLNDLSTCSPDKNENTVSEIFFQTTPRNREIRSGEAAYPNEKNKTNGKLSAKGLISQTPSGHGEKGTLLLVFKPTPASEPFFSDNLPED